MIDRNLAVSVARCGTTTVDGTFFRHVSQRVEQPLTGTSYGGRWGPAGAFPVLYLGRPVDAVVAEAYRHLVDPIEGMTAKRVRPRRVVTCNVNVSKVLDLRDTKSLSLVGLSHDDLQSTIGQYARCQRIAKAAHQLGVRGIIAPSATGIGETLALFDQHLPADECPELVESRLWEHLPADPREAGTRSAPRGH
jgi:RES domain-containing protein